MFRATLGGISPTPTLQISNGTVQTFRFRFGYFECGQKDLSLKRLKKGAKVAA